MCDLRAGSLTAIGRISIFVKEVWLTSNSQAAVGVALRAGTIPNERAANLAAVRNVSVYIKPIRLAVVGYAGVVAAIGADGTWNYGTMHFTAIRYDPVSIEVVLIADQRSIAGVRVAAGGAICVAVYWAACLTSVCSVAVLIEEVCVAYDLIANIGCSTARATPSENCWAGALTSKQDLVGRIISAGVAGEVLTLRRIALRAHGSSHSRAMHLAARPHVPVFIVVAKNAAQVLAD